MTHQFCAHHFPGNPSCWEICHPLLDPREAHTYQDVFGAQLRLSSGFFGGSCASRAGWVSVFPTFPNISGGVPELRIEFSKDMMNYGNGY